MEDRTFTIYPEIEMWRVTFKNRYGLKLAGHLYLPVGYADKKNPAIVVSGPFGAVKEQASGLYAQEFARMGFVSLAFDPSFCGESVGQVRNLASPEIFTEDYSAAVDFLTTIPYVDQNRIGAQGICGLSGMALTAASSDTRIKAVATASMYDMCRSMQYGLHDSLSHEERVAMRKTVSETRTADAQNGELSYGPEADGDLSKEAYESLDQATKRFYEYYHLVARHPRAVNFVSSWANSTPMQFLNFSLMDFIEEISPRPILLIAGENAHSRYFSEDVYEKAADPKELYIVKGADHVDLYNNMEKIPFMKLKQFFLENLK